MTSREHENCPSCICGKRAPVQASKMRGPGTISWAEHELAWSDYAKRYGREQSATRIAERGGFGYDELVMLLGHPPDTWAPAGSVAERERG